MTITISTFYFESSSFLLAAMQTWRLELEQLFGDQDREVWVLGIFVDQGYQSCFQNSLQGQNELLSWGGNLLFWGLTFNQT